MLFDHMKMVFDELPYGFLTIDELPLLSLELCENDGTLGAMAHSDITYDEVYIEEIDSSKFTAFINASASGSHRKESDIL
jgi:hypothetical protein